MATKNDARKAQTVFLDRFVSVPEIKNVFIEKFGSSGYAVRVVLYKKSSTKLPNKLNDVPVTFRYFLNTKK